ncbi:hypothetical protein [Seongchinamella sediminis]|uniref:hypothetical protein n=1 Tax=Seongchinamella sediminis TaxID=2283635 RepID=UPI0010586A22|nr:hypothetical protein [Seongchinamella sediminis]
MTIALLFGCGQQVDSSFCATHASDHWQHRAEFSRLEIDYVDSGALTVQLWLPKALAAGMAIAVPADILAVPDFCNVGVLQRSEEGAEVSLRFQAECGDRKPDSLAVPLLEQQQEIAELEVSMNTPAVTKHFVVHHQCEGALFNVAGGADGE